MVKDRQGVTHTTVCLLRHDIQRFFTHLDTFLCCHFLQIGDGIWYRDTVEVIHLTTTEYCRQYLVLLRRSKDENGIRGRFFKCLEQGVKGTLREHVNLIDDIHGVLTDLRRYTHLVNEVTDILYGVVRCRIEFVNIKRALFIKGLTGLTFVACIEAVLGIRAVDGLCKDTRAGRFTHSARSAKQIRVRQMVRTDRVLQGLRQRLLTYH